LAIILPETWYLNIPLAPLFLISIICEKSKPKIRGLSSNSKEGVNIKLSKLYYKSIWYNTSFMKWSITLIYEGASTAIFTESINSNVNGYLIQLILSEGNYFSLFDQLK
jgi:hypothetical protein